jgi:hypothetical protein
MISHKKSDGWSHKHMISSKNDFEYVSSNPVDKDNALHVETTPASLLFRCHIKEMALLKLPSNGPTVVNGANVNGKQNR